MPIQYTPNLGLPYPEGSDPAAVPKDVKALADKLDATINAAGNPASVLPGDLVVSAAATRAGCLLCDGAAVSRTDYAALFAAIGTAYGAGDTSSTFNLPDYRGRLIVGAGAGPGLSVRSRGDRFGEESHLLAVGELPVHNHGVTDPGHNHSVTDPQHSHAISSDGARPNVPISNSAWGGPWAGSTAGANYQTTNVISGSGSSIASATSTARAGVGISIQNKATGLTIQNTGSGAGHNNMPPTGVANVFIKT